MSISTQIRAFICKDSADCIQHNHLGLLTIFLLLVSTAHAAPKEIEYRARITKMNPEQPAAIAWRYGGEGLGGDVVSGVVTRLKPAAPKAADPLAGGGPNMDNFLDGPPKDRIIVKGDTFDTVFLRKNVWSDWRGVSDFGRAKRRSITFTLAGHETGRDMRDTQLEIEFRYGKETIRRFTIDGPDGPTFGVIIPLDEVDDDGKPTPAFKDQLVNIRELANAKVALLKNEPWIDLPTPKKFAIVTDCSGYDTGAGYGVRNTDKRTMVAELEVMDMLGINGLRAQPAFLKEMTANREGVGASLRHAYLEHTIGYPIPTVKLADGKKPRRSPGDGCPYHPDNLKDIDERCRAAAKHLLEDAQSRGVDTAWGLTVDEIGNVFGRSPEKSEHAGSCPHCREAFREYVKADGRTLEDFGAPSWDDIRSVYGYWSTNYWESHRILKQAVADAKKRMADAAKKMDDLEFSLEEPDKKVDPAQALIDAKARLEKLEWNSVILRLPEDKQTHRLSEQGWHLLTYYSRLFVAESSAKLFEPLQRAYEEQNQRKRDAIAAGDTTSDVAQQPWIYSYCLRTNGFLMRGHSFDFIDFYRKADNAFFYETSNRDRRIWHWDAYLCDVGRTVDRLVGKKFGIYVKPHRGAGLQRALASASRGAEIIFWYTYGPEWRKGDGFGGSAELRKEVAKTSRLLAAAEDVLYDNEWVYPAEIALLRPRPGEYFSGSASWENGKWIFSALQHSHLPIDALDGHLVEQGDLSQYKVIAVSGSHVRRATAERLKQWVADGGTLYTSGYGMAKDESGADLVLLHEVFGVSNRKEPEIWSKTPYYGATRLRPIEQTSTPPDGAKVTGSEPLSGSFVPAVGREILQPTGSAKVIATYADSRAAVVRNSYGKGTAWLVGTYAGLEYAWETMNEKDYDTAKRGWVSAPMLEAGVRPVVDASHDLVEGILVKQKDGNKRAAAIINWSMKPLENLTVRLHINNAKTIRSAMLKQPLPIKQNGDWAVVTIPSIDEGDVLIID